MPVFTYRGTNRAGATVSGELAATSKSELINSLKRKQIKICSIELQLIDGGVPQSIEATESSTGAAEEQA